MKAIWWDIRAFDGVGPIDFGTARNQVRSFLGPNFESFRKGADALTLTDAYDELGLHFFYDTDDRLESLVAFGSCQICYKNTFLLKDRVSDVCDRLCTIGVSFRYDDGYYLYYFDTAGFVLYAPNDFVEAVTVYRKACFEEYN
jgi:hypothetical protein